MVIGKFISMDKREQLDGIMYQLISPYGVWWIYMGKLKQFNRSFIVVSCTLNHFGYSVSSTPYYVHALMYTLRHACTHVLTHVYMHVHNMYSETYVHI